MSKFHGRLFGAALLIASQIVVSALSEGCSRAADRPIVQSKSRAQPQSETAKPIDSGDRTAQVMQAQTQTVSLLETQFIERVKDVVTRYKLTQQPIDRLSFEWVEQSTLRTRLVNVRERHTSKGGGDPSTAPRLFSVRLDVASGVLWTDALSPTGEFEPLPKSDR